MNVDLDTSNIRTKVRIRLTCPCHITVHGYEVNIDILHRVSSLQRSYYCPYFSQTHPRYQMKSNMNSVLQTRTWFPSSYEYIYIYIYIYIQSLHHETTIGIKHQDTTTTTTTTNIGNNSLHMQFVDI